MRSYHPYGQGMLLLLHIRYNFLKQRLKALEITLKNEF